MNRLLKQSHWGRNLRFSGTTILLTGWIGTGVASVASPGARLSSAFRRGFGQAIQARKTGRGGDLRDPMFLAGGTFTSRAPLIVVIGAAYDVPFFGPTARIAGGPEWIRSLDLVYEIEAKPGKDSRAGSQASQQCCRRCWLTGSNW